MLDNKAKNNGFTEYEIIITVIIFTVCSQLVTFSSIFRVSSLFIHTLFSLLYCIYFYDPNNKHSPIH